MSSEDQLSDTIPYGDLSVAPSGDAELSAKTRRVIARRILEEKEELRRLRDLIDDPLFDIN